MEDKKDIKDLLEEEIRTEFEKLKSLTPGEKGHSEAVEAMVKLYKLNIDETENNRAFMERSDRDIDREREYQIKIMELNEAKLNRYFRFGAEMAGVMLPLMFYGIWMKRGFKFEETGTFTSTTFRGLFNKFRPQ